jgi:hypothetical protein
MNPHFRFQISELTICWSSTPIFMLVSASIQPSGGEHSLCESNSFGPLIISRAVGPNDRAR